MGFFNIKELKSKKLAEGVELRVMPGEKMTMTFFYLEPGAEIPEHSHTHEQMGTVLKGTIELIIGEEKRTVNVGEPYHVPPDVIHRGRCGDAPAEVFEAFSPAREDFQK